MLTKSSLCSRRARAAVVSLVAGSAASLASGQTVFNAAVDNLWSKAGNWTGGVPAAGVDTTINANLTCLLNVAGTCGDLNIGKTTTGQLDINNPGTLTADRIFVGTFNGVGASGTLNIGQIAGAATVNSPVITIGFEGTGTVNVRDGSVVNTQALNLGGGAAAASTATMNQGNLASSFSRVNATGNVGVGVNAGATATYNLNRGLIVTPLINIGVGAATPTLAAATGTMNLTSLNQSQIALDGIMNIGSDTFNGASGRVLADLTPATTVPASFAIIRGIKADLATLNPNAIINVNGTTNAQLRGWANYDVKVSYFSDEFAVGATGNKRINLTTDRNMLLRSDIFNVATGITAGNAAPAGDANPAATTLALANRLLADTRYNITWGNNTAGQNIRFNNTSLVNGAAATISLPFDPATIPDNTGASPFPRANIAGRLRMLAFGQNTVFNSVNAATSSGTSPGDKQGLIRNITRLDSALPAIAGNTVFGRTPDVNSDFSVGVQGVARKPVAQDPRIAALHALGLNGSGVVMGQIEGGRPFWAQGDFEDWNAANGSRIQYTDGFTGAGQLKPLLAMPSVGGANLTTKANSSSAHASRVASIMIGFDPLGIQVDGQSRFEPAANRVGNGFGFTGVAPGATLINSDANTDVGAGPDNFAAFAGLALAGCKVINTSFGQSNAGGTLYGSGTNPYELTADYWVARMKDLTYTKSAGNEGAFPPAGSALGNVTSPGGAYNAIVVANWANVSNISYPTNYDVNDWNIAQSSSIGPIRGTTRSKPDIAAQGTGNYSAFTMESIINNAAGNPTGINDPAFNVQTNAGLYSTRSRNDQIGGTSGFSADDPVTGTSFAAPTVAGVAAIMIQRAKAVPALNDGQKSLVVKSILQTSSDKPPSWGQGFTTTPAAFTKVPLSYYSGSGFMNPIAAVTLLNKGKKGHGVANPVVGDGWNYETLKNTDDDAPGFGFAPSDYNGHLYSFAGLKATQSFVSTVNWMRAVNSDYAPGTNDNLTTLTYTAAALTHIYLSLYVFDTNVFALQLVAQSNSDVDNLQHIYLPKLPKDGDYFLRVSTPDAAFNQEYGLSWTFNVIPTPSGAAVLVTLGLYAARRRRT